MVTVEVMMDIDVLTENSKFALYAKPLTNVPVMYE